MPSIDFGPASSPTRTRCWSRSEPGHSRPL
jgi:hypothetical protein